MVIEMSSIKIKNDSNLNLTFVASKQVINIKMWRGGHELHSCKCKWQASIECFLVHPKIAQAAAFFNIQYDYNGKAHDIVANCLHLIKIVSSASLCMLPSLSQAKRINRSKAKELECAVKRSRHWWAQNEANVWKWWNTRCGAAYIQIFFPTNFLFLVGGDWCDWIDANPKTYRPSKFPFDWLCPILKAQLKFNVESPKFKVTPYIIQLTIRIDILKAIRN